MFSPTTKKGYHVDLHKISEKELDEESNRCKKPTLVSCMPPEPAHERMMQLLAAQKLSELPKLN